MRTGCAEGSSGSYGVQGGVGVGWGVIHELKKSRKRGKPNERTLPNRMSKGLRTPRNLFSIVHLLSPAKPSPSHNIQMITGDVHGPAFIASHVQNQFY
jgi:hypothetical protein